MSPASNMDSIWRVLLWYFDTYVCNTTYTRWVAAAGDPMPLPHTILSLNRDYRRQILLLWSFDSISRPSWHPDKNKIQTIFMPISQLRVPSNAKLPTSHTKINASHQ